MCAVAALLIAALGLSQMRPVILQYSQNVAEGILLNAADEAVVNVLRENKTMILCVYPPTVKTASRDCKSMR